MIADWLPAETRSRIMRSIRAKDTKPEQILRKLLFADGYRYRLHSAKLPGKPDVVFTGRKKVIFVHGCFWHQHPSARCSITGLPTSNTAYWEPKLKRNAARDAENVAMLKELGWKAQIVWECELERNPEKELNKLRKFLGPPKKIGAE
jgi:DNA mismatch endonuclease (patch repair protein)